MFISAMIRISQVKDRMCHSTRPENNEVQKGHLGSAPLMFVYPRMSLCAPYLPSQLTSDKHYSDRLIAS